MSGPLRIAVYGPESTGKTELAGKLAAHFNAPLVSEYARELWDRQGGLNLDDMLPVAREQWRREDEAAHQAERLIICDTDALTTVLWSDLLYGTCPVEVRRRADQRCRNYALYLLLDIDVPFVSDPQRCFPAQVDREKCMRIWRGALERRQLSHVLIQGGWDQREQRAIEAIKRLITD